MVVRQYIVGGANRRLFSVIIPPQLYGLVRDSTLSQVQQHAVVPAIVCCCRLVLRAGRLLLKQGYSSLNQL